MRSICFFVPALDLENGIFRVVYNLAVVLSKRADLRISFITPCSKIDVALKVGERFSLYDLRSGDHLRKARYFKAVSLIRTVMLREKIDILVVAGMEWCLVVWLACRSLTGLELIAWEHLHFKAGPRFRLEWVGKRLACKRFAGVVCITKKDYHQYKKYMKTEERLYQIYNLTDYKQERPSYDFSSHKIMSCGYLAPIKGFDMLIEVAEKCLTQCEGWIWEIYGEGEERLALERLIMEKDLSDRVRLKGYHKDIQQLYKEYSFFVLTSRVEGMGMVLIEAQKSGLPVVSFDISCGPSDVIQDGENGYLIEPFDLDQMAERIQGLMEDEELRKKFSRASEIRHKEFGRNYIIAKWDRLIDEISGGKDGTYTAV